MKAMFFKHQFKNNNSKKQTQVQASLQTFYKSDSNVGEDEPKYRHEDKTTFYCNMANNYPEALGDLS